MREKFDSIATMSAEKEAKTKPTLRADAPAFVPKSPKTPLVENFLRETQCSRFSRKSSYHREGDPQSPGTLRPILGSQLRVPRPILGRKENFIPKMEDDRVDEKVKPPCRRGSQIRDTDGNRKDEVCPKCNVKRSFSSL